MPLPILASFALGSMAAPAVGRLAEGVGRSFQQILESTGELVHGKDDAAAVRNQPADDSDMSARLDQLRQELQVALKQFGQLTDAYLRRHRVDTHQPIELKSDGRDGIQAGPHPQRAEIEEAFRQHPELLEAFRDVAAKFLSLEQLRHPQSAGAVRGQLHVQLIGETAVPLLL